MVLTKMLNLQCKLGHKHYSPTPKEWVGQDCGFSIGNKTCKHPLRLIRKRRGNG